MNKTLISQKTLFKGATTEIVEKKSRFIATVAPAETEAEALSFIEDIKKQYHDARHNCSAFVIAGNPPLERCSDDGEPQRTAGKPMLDILLAKELTNAVAVVTRYFGGILLGTGGLVRAYQGALNQALSECVIIEKLPGVLISVTTDYTGLGKLQYYTSQNDISIQDTLYTENVVTTLAVPRDALPFFQNHITDITAGKADTTLLNEIYYADVNGKRLIFTKL